LMRHDEISISVRTELALALDKLRADGSSFILRHQ
jgi:hypothetical protein